MAEALGVAASIAGLLSLAQGAVSAATEMYGYVQDVRHESTERREFFQRFKRIENNLDNLYKRILYIENQFAPGKGPRANDGSIIGMKLRGGDRLFAISQDIREPGGDYDNLQLKLRHVLAETESFAGPKYKERLRRARWKWKKASLLKEQNEILQLITCLRDMISDGDAEVNYDTHLQVGHMVREKAADRTVEILNWICQPTLSLREPPNPAPAVALNPSSNRFIDHSDTYTQWFNDASWQLNCYGKPGSGKSVLAEAIAADLRKRLEPQGTPILSIFFRNKQRARQTLDVVFCNLLRQLLTTGDSTGPPRIPEEVMQLWNKSRSIARGSLSEDQARNLVLDQISRFSTKKFLVIDAIDEAEGCKDGIDDEIRQLRSLGVCILTTDRKEARANYDAAYCQECGTGPLELPWLCRKCTGHFGQKVWLCRECYVVKGIRCGDPSHVMTPPERVNVEISASREDIELLVTRFLDDNFSGGDTGGDDDMFSGNVPLLRALKDKMGQDFWDSLPSKVGQAAEGNFLYARLFLDQLRLQRNQAGILALTEQLDRGGLENLDTQYDAMLTLCLERNDKYGAQVARDYLSVVASAYEVLTFEQLSHATAISPRDTVLDDFAGRLCSKEVVRRDTHGLLTTQTSGAADSFPISFFHRSLTAYMEEHLSKWFPEATQSILDACISYLSLDVFSSPFDSRDKLDKALKEYPFASYAACYWGLHACSAQGTVQNNLQVLKLLNDRDRLDCVIQISWNTRSLEEAHWDVPAGITPLHFCAFYGLESQCQAILTFDTADVFTGENSYNQTPLIYACRKMHIGVARMLLDAGADPNHLTNKGKSPLIEAIESFDLEIIDLLLSSEDIDVNARAPGRQGTTALIRATELGQDSVVEKLLACGDIEVNKPDGWGCTAMSRAVQHVQMGCVRLLLSCSATDLTLTEKVGNRSALDWTADEIVLNSGVPTDEIDSVADVLLADRRHPKPSNEAISVAISQGRTGLLETFFKWNDLDLLYKDEHGRNFLHLAASTGDVIMLELIHKQFANSHSFEIDSRDNHGASPLHLACQNLSQDDELESVVFLLDAGADPILEDGAGLSALAKAKLASPGLWDSHIKPIFEARGVAIDAALENMTPTLLSAIATGSVDIVEAELDDISGPLDPETDVYTGQTLLWRVIEQEEPQNTDLLKLILPRSTDFLSNRCNQGRTCAHLAVLRCSLDALRLLTEAGIDLDFKDRWGMTALQLAQSSYRYDMCVHLISRGAELPPAHEIRPALLQAAVAGGDVGPVGRLLEAGIDTRHRDETSGMTALQAAERLLEDAERDVNDDLIDQWDGATMASVSVFEAEIAKAPEVERRKKVRDLVRDAQGHYLGQWGGEPRPGSQKGLEKALVALKGMDSNKILTPGDWLQQAVKDSEATSTAGQMRATLAYRGTR